MEESNSRNVKNPVSTKKYILEKIFQLVTEGHPLMNVVILDNIIRYLDYKDLKNLRLVCQRWKEVTKRIFWKFSRIKVSGKLLLAEQFQKRALEIAEQNRMLTDTFESTFPSPAGLPTDAMRFEQCINRRTLEYFWKERGSLTITNVSFYYFSDPTKECIDLNRFITPTLTTLNMNTICLNNKITVSLKMLANIQNLRLMGCEILLDGKIAPKNLDLKSCSVIYEGKLFKPGVPRNTNSQKILINDFVDFSKIKKLVLVENFWKVDVGKDMTELEYLQVVYVELTGLHSSQWKTNFVDLGYCICIGDKMEIKSIPGMDHAGTVDVEIESLPKNLEHLWFGIYGSLSSLPQPQIYPNLKSVTIRILRTRDLRILDFTNCTSLIDFQLSVPSGMYQMDFNRIKLPNSIKNMKLRNVFINTDAPWQLDSLVLYKYPFSVALGALCHFTTLKLVMEFNSKLEREEDLMIIVNHWRNSRIEQLAFGYLGVNEVKKYFLLTNTNNIGKVEAIDCARFDKLSSLNVHKDLLPLMGLF